MPRAVDNEEGGVMNLLRRVAADFFAHDPSQIFWRSGLRNGVGVAIPLLWGILANQPAAGVVASVGALVSGFAALSGSWSRRLRTMAWAALWVAVAAGIGTLTGRQLAVSLPLIALSGGLAGLLGAVSPEFAQVGTLATNAQVVFAGLALPPGQAGGLALEVLAGGALQWVLLVLFGRWQLQADGSNSLRQVLAALAHYCRRPSRDADLAVARALVVAEGRVDDPAIAADKRRRLEGLLRAVDSVRNDVVGLRVGPHQGEAAQAAVAAVAQALDGLRGQLLSAEARRRQAKSQVVSAVQALGGLGAQAAEPWLRQRLEHLRIELERMQDLIDGRWLPAIESAAVSSARGSWRERIWTPIRATLTWRSPTFRHATRVCLTMAAAVALYHRLGLTRGYWIPLTVMVVLKPDFFSTVGRGLGRALGTAVGVVLGTGVVAVAGDVHTGWGLVAIVLDGAAMYSVLNYNYALFSVGVSAEIVMLLAFFERVGPVTAMVERLTATVLGSALALVAYGLLPTWQRREIPGELARLLQAERWYLQAILAGSGTVARRRQTRLARVRCAGVVNAALSEPSPSRFDPDRVAGFLDGLHQLAEELMALEFTAEWPPYRHHPGFAAFAARLEDRLAALAAVLEGADRHPHRVPPPGAPLQPEGVHDPTLQAVARRLTAIADELTALLPLARAADGPTRKAAGERP